MFNKGLVLGVLLVACALLYELYCPVELRNARVAEVAASWNEEIVFPARKPSRIAVGVNSNLDLIVSAVDLLRALQVEASSPRDHGTLSNTLELEQVVGYSMEHCAGLERVFLDQTQFLHIVETAKQIEHTHHIGGNGALMAEKIMQLDLDVKVMLVGPMGPTLKGLLHSDILTPPLKASAADEVHMILEYSKGEHWGGVTSTCANRVIFSHDLSNSKLVALEEFGASLSAFNPDLVILSGAHLLDSQPAEFQTSRLADIAHLLDSVPRSIPVHWELATVGDLQYFHQLSKAIFSRIDSLGLNEQELLSAAVSAQANFSSFPRKPSVGHVSDLLLWLMKMYADSPLSRLTRVHFHSLTFHVIATLAGGPWSNNKEAVMAGARVAGLQACDTDRIHPDQFELRLSSYKLSATTDQPSVHYHPQPSASAQWSRNNVQFELSPVLVCKNPSKTVGLGDAISSVGLLYSNFVHVKQ